MKNTFRVFISVLCLSFLAACSKDDPSPTPPTPTPLVSDLIKKVWSASNIQWDGNVQYDKTATSNLIAGYAQFKLDLSSSSSVSLTEYDGNKFTGTYSLSSDNKTLTLSSLKTSDGSEPTGTGGTLAFTISGVPTASSLVMESTTAYAKASNKKIRLSLVNP
ncbi:hypothetical protein [Aquirufa aurantiipilula]|uniref:Lipocalin-like domain-containing protein n=1 Tax=Aquirufa aurantiipilula TaxID=2696561 RepID=A0ABT6BKJ4_9BACT|nr:hypothetical protein [Aquirufa aurantiipilula]MDF5690927.1 hypothetical protein [Aquirufa aurantiipilula]